MLVLMKSPHELRKQQEGLWRNCADSITHALEHLSSVSQVNEQWCNQKWAILSVAHAAEVYCNLLLCMFDHNHPNHPKGHYPPLDKARELLLKDHLPRLFASERLIIKEVLSPLADQRNTLMHMPAPEVLSATDTAIALLSLLHIIRRRTSTKTSEFFNQSPPVEQDIVEHIEWRKFDKWQSVIEQLLEEEYGGYVECCDNCGAIAIVPDSSECQACFEPASFRGV